MYPAYDFVSGRRNSEEEEVHESVAGIAFCEIQKDLEIAEVEKSVPCIALWEREGAVTLESTMGFRGLEFIIH